MRPNYSDREINEALETAATELGHFDVQHEVDRFIHTGKTVALREFLSALPEVGYGDKCPAKILKLMTELEEATGTYDAAAEWLHTTVALAKSGADIQIAREIIAELGTTNERIISTLEEIDMSDRLILVFFRNSDYVKGTPKGFTETSVTLDVGGRELTITKGQVDTGTITSIYRVPAEALSIKDHRVLKNIKTKSGIYYDFAIRSNDRYLLFLDDSVETAARPSEIVEWEEAEID